MLVEALPTPLLTFGSWYMNNLNDFPIQTKIVTAATLAMSPTIFKPIARRASGRTVRMARSAWRALLGASRL